jgi:hypothetical protein
MRAPRSAFLSTSFCEKSLIIILPTFQKAKKKPRIGGCRCGVFVFSHSAWVASGVREIPAPAARKEQLSDGQYQQRTLRAAQRFARRAAHVKLSLQCHGWVPGLKG